jgi:hypothetical protein
MSKFDDHIDYILSKYIDKVENQNDLEETKSNTDQTNLLNLIKSGLKNAIVKKAESENRLNE